MRRRSLDKKRSEYKNIVLGLISLKFAGYKFSKEKQTTIEILKVECYKQASAII
jgi:hypothetical protein